MSTTRTTKATQKNSNRFFLPDDIKKLPKDVKQMTDQLPQDKMMLLSVINTKLRDKYPSLDALCDDLGADREEIIRSLGSIGYAYDPQLNRFR